VPHGCSYIECTGGEQRYIGSQGARKAPERKVMGAPRNDRTPLYRRGSENGRGGFRTCDLSRVNQRTICVETSRFAAELVCATSSTRSRLYHRFRGIPLDLDPRAALPAQIRERLIGRCDWDREARVQ